MPRRSRDELSHTEKGFRVAVGYYEKAGRKKPRVFWLGHVLEHARYLAFTYRKAYKAIRAQGRDCWTDEEVKNVRQFIDDGAEMIRTALKGVEQSRQTLQETATFAVPSATANPSATRSTGEATATVMVYGALDAYVDAVEAKALSPSYKRRVAETIDDLKHYLADMQAVAALKDDTKALRRYLDDPKGSGTYRKDCPLAEVDKLWLERLTDYIKSRPLSRKKDRGTGKREPIKPATVKTQLQHWRQAFDWIDAASESPRFGEWEAPKKMTKLFECDLNQLRTKGERDRAADGPDHLTVAEIKALTDAATDRQRMLILMGLFTGQGQTELRWTRRDEFDLVKARFIHRRNKTGQRGEYWLPPELVKLLKQYLADMEPIEDNIAFSTRDGQPLVTDTSDSVRQMFDDVRAAAGIIRPSVTFYACRRYLGDWAKRRGGAELRDAALAHAGRTVGDKHYSNYRDFAKVEQVAREMYRAFKHANVFAFPDKKEKEEPTKDKAAQPTSQAA